jgi:hypothetical protein
VIVDEQPPRGPVLRRLAVCAPTVSCPANSRPGKARKVVPIDPYELEAALAADGLEGP